MSGVGTVPATGAGLAGTARAGPRRTGVKRRYWVFAMPAVAVIAAVIVFPWGFTAWMSVNDWKLTGDVAFVGLDNFLTLFTDARVGESILHTLYFTLLAVTIPIVLGTLAAVVFHRNFPLRGFLRGVFILPMMATPVAVALVWTMMFHPQLGVLNYLLTSIGLPPSLWTYHPTSVIPTLVLVEVWHWTPLVMLIVLGGLANLPIEPYEAADIDGASAWHKFRYITLPLVSPYIMIALILRTIDSLKAFDTIYVISQGGPGTASETINIFLYLQAFAFFKLGYASAVVLIFFTIIIVLSLVLLQIRQRSKWTA
jgi:multiple sugar transport system permease protein